MSIRNKIRILKAAFLLVLPLAALTDKAAAQADLLKESEKIQLAYKTPSHLSFDLKYTYAFETEPTVILDSSLGTFKISGNHYWGVIDSAEFMQNDSFAIVVYKPGRLINVSNPKGLYPQAAGFAALDSLLGKDGYTSSLTRSGHNKVMVLTFSDPLSPYKEFNVSYDSVSYQVSEVAYIIKEEYMTGDGFTGEHNNNSPGKYLQVKAVYKNYDTTAFSSSVFDAANYFTVSNGSYRPLPPYSEYEVFLASPNFSSTQQPVH